MQTRTAEQVRANAKAFPAAGVTYTGAAAFVIAAAWFWLATKGVTVAPAPRTGPNLSPEQAMRIHYQWQATTLPQERFYTSIAMAGFVCLAAAAIFLRDLPGHDRPLGRIGAMLVSVGSLLWIAGNVLVLGGHRAVGLMAAHANPIETTNSIAFTVDTVGQAFGLAAFALIGPRARRGHAAVWASRVGWLRDHYGARDAGHRRVLCHRQR